MSRWKALNTWDRDLPGLSDQQLLDYVALARKYEASANRPGTGRNKKAASDWRKRRESAENETETRGMKC